MPADSFQFTVVIQADQSTRLSDLPFLMAKAVHPNDAEAFTRNVESRRQQIFNAVKVGELMARHPADSSPGTVAEVDLPDEAFCDADALCSFLESRGLGLHVTPHGNGPTYWTIRNAARDICAQQGFASGPTGWFQQGLLDAVHAGDLQAWNPMTLARCDAANVLNCWELLSPADVNRWLRRHDTPYAWIPQAAAIGAASPADHPSVAVATMPLQATSESAQDVRQTLKRSALVNAYGKQWPTVESDLRHANENGLANEAKAPAHGLWIETAALEWARRNGKLTALTPLPTDGLDAMARQLVSR